MKKFKCLYLLLLGIVCGLAFSACSSKDNDYDEPSLKVLNPELSFDGTGGVQTINVQADAQPTASVIEGADWCSVAYKGQAAGTYNFDVTVAASQEDEVTTATVRIILGDSRKDVTITRAKKGAVVTPDVPPADMNKTAMEVAQLMYPGWNLGNTLEAGDSKNLWKNAGIATETSWQSTKTTKQVIDFVKAQGFKSVRIPCSWVMGHITDAEKCTIDPAWMKRVKEVVDYCIKDGLYVIINQHWDGGWIEHNGFTADTDVEGTKAKLTKIWTQIATAFKDYDEHLIFAGMNEPGVGAGTGSIIEVNELSNRLAEYEQTFINAVRRVTGGNNALRILVIQGPHTDIDDTMGNDYISKITDTADNRLMMEVHFYGPYQFCQMTEDAYWGKQWYYWGKDNQSGDADRTSKNNEEFVSAQMAKMKKTYVDKGIPVIIGEFGADQRFAIGKDALHDASIRAYYKAVTEFAISNGCVPMVWDINAGKGMSMLNRTTLKIDNANMMDGITAGVAAAKWPAK